MDAGKFAFDVWEPVHLRLNEFDRRLVNQLLWKTDLLGWVCGDTLLQNRFWADWDLLLLDQMDLAIYSLFFDQDVYRLVWLLLDHYQRLWLWLLLQNLLALQSCRYVPPRKLLIPFLRRCFIWWKLDWWRHAMLLEWQLRDFELSEVVLVDNFQERRGGRVVSCRLLINRMLAHVVHALVMILSHVFLVLVGRDFRQSDSNALLQQTLVQSVSLLWYVLNWVWREFEFVVVVVVWLAVIVLLERRWSDWDPLNL